MRRPSSAGASCRISPMIAGPCSDAYSCRNLFPTWTRCRGMAPQDSAPAQRPDGARPARLAPDLERTLAELDGDLDVLAPAQDVELDRVTGPRVAEQGRE